MKYKTRESKLIKSKNTIDVEIGLNDTKKAIELLYSQYTRPIRTCVQELVSNAYDAMNEANNDAPIKVQLPNALNDFTFFVRDFGNSMDLDMVKNVYMRVNASTKSKSNKAIGGFGIGSKTPWAYTDTFILTTYLDGQETQYMLVKGRSNVSIIHQGDTKEENGTKVSFQTKQNDSENFKTALKRICLNFKTKPIVNSDVNFEYEKHIKINDHVSVVSDSLLNHKVYANLGGVLYSIDFFKTYDIEEFLKSESSIIINFNVGNLYPLQTREALFTNQNEGEFNSSMIKSVTKRAKIWIDKYIKQELNKLKTVENVIEFYRNDLFSINQNFNIDGFTVNSSSTTWGRHEIDFLENKVSFITRNSKRWGYGKNKNARKEKKKYINHKELKDCTFYFSEESSGKARLCSRLRLEAEYNDCIVLEKELLNPELFKKLVKLTNATDVMEVDVPKVERNYNSGYTVDKEKVAVYDKHGSRTWRNLYLNKLYEDNFIVFEKGKKSVYGQDILEKLGYTVVYVAPSKVKKLLKKEEFFTEDVVSLESIAIEYSLYLTKKYCKKFKVSNRFQKFLPENKQKLMVDTNSSINFNYGRQELITELLEKYSKLINQNFKSLVKRKLRVYNLIQKVPLVKVVEDCYLEETQIEHLKQYVQQRI